MAKWRCKLCDLSIRRPVDHVYCLGALDHEHLEEKELMKREITREIKIPDELRTK